MPPGYATREAEAAAYSPALSARALIQGSEELGTTSRLPSP